MFNWLAWLAAYYAYCQGDLDSGITHGGRQLPINNKNDIDKITLLGIWLKDLCHKVFQQLLKTALSILSPNLYLSHCLIYYNIHVHCISHIPFFTVRVPTYFMRLNSTILQSQTMFKIQIPGQDLLLMAWKRLICKWLVR